MELAEGMTGLGGGTDTEEQVLWGTYEWGRFGGLVGWSGVGRGGTQNMGLKHDPVFC